MYSPNILHFDSITSCIFLNGQYKLHAMQLNISKSGERDPNSPKDTKHDELNFGEICVNNAQDILWKKLIQTLWIKMIFQY